MMEMEVFPFFSYTFSLYPHSVKTNRAISRNLWQVCTEQILLQIGFGPSTFSPTYLNSSFVNLLSPLLSMVSLSLLLSLSNTHAPTNTLSLCPFTYLNSSFVSLLSPLLSITASVLVSPLIPPILPLRSRIRANTRSTTLVFLAPSVRTVRYKKRKKE